MSYQRAKEFADLSTSFAEQLDYTLKKRETKLIYEALGLVSKDPPMTEEEYYGLWSEEDQRRARLEGWHLWNEGFGFDYLRICAYDPKTFQPAFMKNADADAFVRWRAAHVSPLHCKAARIAREEKEAWDKRCEERLKRP